MPVTADWQLDYRGLTLGPGSPFQAPRVEGLTATPEVRTGDRTRMQRHGLLPGDDWLGGRTITLELQAVQATCDNPAAFTDAYQQLREAFAPGGPEALLTIQLPYLTPDGSPVQLNVRARRYATTADRRWARRIPAFVVELFATDPRLYGAEQTSAATLPTASGGATFNAAFNWTFGTAGVGGSMELTNRGTFPTPVRFRITGPADDPQIVNVTQDRTLAFDLLLQAGEFLDVDSDTRTVLLNGTQNRYSSLITATSDWFDLDPGVNEISFAAAANTAATLTASWRSAWL